ncbi:hypothetical protein [Dyadobacter psychrotolerans]|uniref:Uncharacterized protein n=1 Tax=Dyadobacter psychrotolerans TaxID=2541721 RepID=A0A4R5DAA5_9BACT|nr:hypothetical protein [Dyadobacter psychrotolerans]TDE10562.1 hypothetical protein E0F88_28180 [Dyadobacter psychrotolerans]
MKTILTIFFLLNCLVLVGQKVKLNVSKNANIAPKTYSLGDMQSIANGSPVSGLKTTGGLTVSDAVMDGNSPAIEKYVEEHITQTIFGQPGTKQYGVTYSSIPVRNAYDKYILPHVSTYEELNNQIYDGNYKKMITIAIGDQLTLLAENHGTYNSLQSKIMLRKAIHEEFAADPFTKDSEQPSYFDDHLYNIYNKTKQYLVYCNDSYYQVDKDGKKIPCNNEWSKGFFMMTSNLAKVNCVLAVVIAKSRIDKVKGDSKLTSDINYAGWNMLYKPLVYYKNQSSDFGVFVSNMKQMQQMTKDGKLHELYDSYYKCPSPQAFGFFDINKVRTASVFNPAK